MAAIYTPGSYFLTASLSFDVINPSDLNNMTQGASALPGLIGGRVKIERGLFTPSWSHWIELDYFTGSASASGDAGSFSQSLSYLAILPIGVTYWFARTAYIDFGLSLGGGLGLAPSYTFSSTPGSGPATASSLAYTGKLGPAFAGRLDGRFWLSQHFAATFSTGLHVFSSQLTASGAPPVNAALTGLSMIGGLTFAFGGAQGMGRTYVEVIHDKPDAKKPATPPAVKAPVKKGASAKPTPTPTSTAQPQTAGPTK